MRREAVACRAMAKRYAGKAEEPFLLNAANTFEELAMVDGATERSSDEHPIRTSVVAAFNKRFAAAIERPELVLCWALGHDRSLAVAFEAKGVWHTLCHRCGHPLRRQSAGRWGEITRAELAQAQAEASTQIKFTPGLPRSRRTARPKTRSAKKTRAS